MRSTVGHRPVKLIISIIFKEVETLKRAEKRLLKLYGAAETLEIRQPFEWTDYYSDELGSRLKRKIICFRLLYPKEKIFRIKLETNRIEDRFRINGKRTVNIDPGYVNDAKLVLLTTKDYTHRIHIGGSIFAESTLFFQEGSFRRWPWTYPDYASEELVDFFNNVRKIYMEDIKKVKSNEINLTEAKEKQLMVVKDITGGQDTVRRLELLGIRRGKTITKISSHFWRGPVTVKVGNAKVAIGHGMARKIILETP